MKKILWFAGSFTLVFVILQVLSGVLLTMFYTSKIPLEGVSTLPSQVEFGSTSIISAFIISLCALGIAFCVTKRINKKTMK